jgi:predicted alpha/beta superfamily hydrolase
MNKTNKFFLMRDWSKTVAIRLLKFFLFFVMLPLSAVAQEKHDNTDSRVDKIKITSGILQEDRTIYIHYPPPNPNANGYPVLYVLDADTHFSLVSEYCDYLSRWDVNVIPEMIIVGITNTDRVRDLTPTHNTLDYFGKVNADSWLKTSGGNEKFLQFIREEVMSYVNSNYATKPFNIFAGHSFGGITTINCMLTHPEMFNAYVAVSPSLWWDREHVLKLAGQTLKKGSTWNKVLVYSDGNEGITDGSTYHTNLLNFDSLIKTRSLAGLRYSYSYYPDENHMTVPVKSYQDALRFIFKDWALPHIKPEEVTGKKIAGHYKMLSQQYGYLILPNKVNTHDWALWLMKDPNTVDNAISLLEMLAETYPTFSDIFETLGDAYLKKDKRGKAIVSYEKALTLDPNASGVKNKLKSLK